MPGQTPEFNVAPPTSEGWPHRPVRGMATGVWWVRPKTTTSLLHTKKNQNQNKIKTSPFFSPPFRLPSSPRGFCPQTSGSPPPRGFPSPPRRSGDGRGGESLAVGAAAARRRGPRPRPAGESLTCLSCSFVSILVFSLAHRRGFCGGLDLGVVAPRGVERGLGFPSAREMLVWDLGVGGGRVRWIPPWLGGVDLGFLGGGGWLLGRVTVLLGCGGNRWKWVGNHRQVVDLLVWNFIAVSGATRG